MRFQRLIIIPILLLLPLCAFSAEDVPPPPPAPSEAPESAPKLFREETGGIVRVKDGKVYVDHGEIHGVTAGLEMDVYRLEVIEDLNGKALDVEETRVGKIRVVEARKQLSVAEVVESDVELERGFRVKFLLPVAEGAAPETGERTDCPEGMIYFSSGGFKYYPSSDVKDNPGPLTERDETTEGFCVDAAPAGHPQVMWLEALEACTARQMRLCEKVELRKACVFGKETVRPAEGPGGTELKLKELDSVREWGHDWKDSPDGASMDAGSCSCAGTRPACFGCYERNCGTMKRKYRCCGEAM